MLKSFFFTCLLFIGIPLTMICLLSFVMWASVYPQLYIIPLFLASWFGVHWCENRS